MKSITVPPQFRTMFQSAQSDYAQGNVRKCLDKLVTLHKIERANGYIADGIAMMYRILAGLEFDNKNYTQALWWNEQAISENSTNMDFLTHRGNTYFDLHDFERANRDYVKALDRDINNGKCLTNYANYLMEFGEYETAKYYLVKALSVKQSEADMANTKETMSYCLLTLGEYEAGFHLYEWRRVTHGESYAEQESYPWPEWEGQPLQGKRLFIRTEQGFGDIIKFSRYINFIISAGCIITIHTDPKLHRFFEIVFSDCQVVSGPQLLDSSAQDYWVFLLSIPSRFKGIPTATPYMVMPPMGGFENKEKPKIGIVWHGNKEQKGDYKRSMSQKDIIPIIEANTNRFHFYSLQLGNEYLPYHGLTYTSPYISDWYDTAQIISAMDLIITVDTSVAHLAGAMRKPVWVMLSTSPGWHYPISGPSTEWYESATLIRQETRGEWDAVINVVNMKLANYPHVPFMKGGLVV